MKQKITNWGNFPVVEKEMKSEDSLQKIKDFVLSHKEVIARAMVMPHLGRIFFLRKD